jgi:type IV pilus assembly protein PilC
VSEKRDVKGNANKLSMEELSLFSYQLSVIMKSGVPYLEGIEIMKDELENGRLKTLSGDIYDDVKAGKKLYESLRSKDEFPGYFIQMTEIAEKTGMLDVEMDRLSRFYDKQEAIRYKIRSALVYPVILFVLMSAVLMLLVLKVFPVFQEVLSSLGGNLPESSKVLLNTAKNLQNAAIWIMAAIGIVVIGFYLYSKSYKGGEKLDSFLLNSKLFSGLYRKLITLRFSQGMSMMVKAGIPFEEAVGMSAPLTGNRHVVERLKRIQQRLINGESIPDAIASEDVFPQLFNQMVRIGVKSGQIDSTLEKLSEIYEVELERSSNRLTSSIEPTLVVVLSVVVGIVLLTVMLPMIQIMSSIG